MHTFLIAFFVVATAEMGDKTQLIALFLAARFHKPAPIIAGILAATLANHFAAGFIGQWLGGLVSENLLHWVLACSFFGTAVWAFVPDKVDEDNADAAKTGSVFVTSFVTFFLAEIGDKTQVATIALAAQFHPLVSVVLGTTLGMMAANVPVVILSRAIADKVSLKWARALSGLLFAGLGSYELMKAVTA